MSEGHSSKSTAENIRELTDASKQLLEAGKQMTENLSELSDRVEQAKDRAGQIFTSPWLLVGIAVAVGTGLIIAARRRS
jgi:ElaB/YqjD/DUF883 family membrane-anchored ribosome-binding protein